MNRHDDWRRWGDAWQQQPMVDAAWLHRQVRRKQRRMVAAVAFEWLGALFAASQVARLLLMPDIGLRWKAWALVALVALVLPILYLSLRLRRGTWRAAAGSVSAQLQLMARRSRVGVRLAWLNILSVPLLLAISLPFAAPWLAPSRWLHDAALRRQLALLLGVNGVVLGVGLVLCVLYLQRQRRRLHELEKRLREVDE